LSNKLSTQVALSIPRLDAGLKLEVHSRGDTHISEQIRKEGIWEAFETELVRRSLKPGHAFLDAGANLGYFTIVGAQCVGEAGRVYAFEPEPRNFALLQSNIALNGFEGRVTAFQQALSDRTGAAQLYLHPDNLGDHRLHADDGSSIRVDLVSGAEALGDIELNLVKVDVQGAEYTAILGLMPLLRKSAAGLRMIVELTPRALRKAGSSGAALIDSLETLGLPFAIVDHLEHRLVPHSAEELRQWCNNVDEYPDDEGFMNIFMGEPPTDC